MKVSFERKVTLGFAIAALALLLIGGAAWWSATRYKSTFLRVNHTHEVLNELEGVLVDVLSMQTSTRGFVLTGSEEVLQPFETGHAQISTGLRRLGGLLADNARQQQRLAQLGPLVDRARDVMRGRIAARRARGLEAARETAEYLRGQEAVQGVRDLVVAMQNEERRLLQDRFRRMDIVGKLTLSTILLATLASVAFVLGAGVMARREFAARTRITEALRASEERFRLMVESVKDYAILMLDPEGRVVNWNAGARRIKGYADEDIVGQHFSRFYPEEAVRAGLPQRALAVATTEGHVEDHGWRTRRDGTLFWADVVITALHNARGELVGFVKVTRDLTATRAAEQQIKALNDDLRRRAALLEATNRELEAFSYSVSHDLRAPLRHIDGFSNLLEKRAAASLDDESRRFLAIISRAAQQMGKLIDDLLAFSRIGRSPLRHETVAHDRLIAEVIADAGYDTAGRAVAWEIGPLPTGHGDPALLRQVWRNLLDNAVKYSGKTAQAQVKVAAVHDPATEEYVFSVRDNGVGFDMAYADKLFGVFQRLHGPAEFEGTGIGLANVRRIIGRHGGRTWAEARVNEGATFYFSLPASSPPPSPST